MNEAASIAIPELLIHNIPRALVMGIEEALAVGAQRAFGAARGMDAGHLPHALGQWRHFHMNEAFHRALTAGDAAPTPINGNGIVTGRTGLIKLARFNIADGFWINGRRSRTRRQMAEANQAIEMLVQDDLFDSYQRPEEIVAFFVACFAKSPHVQPDTPHSIHIAVPSRDMKGWLFKETLHAFVRRYDGKPGMQQDLAIPTLKKQFGKQDKDGSTQ
jgi:hypothetical protein